MNRTYPVELVIPQDGGPEILAESYTLSPAGGQEFLIYIDSQEGDAISAAIASGRFSFPRPYYLLPELVAPGQRVLDLGAHIGTFSLFAAALGYQVVSVEASPRNAALLRLSAQKNGFAAPRIVSAAVSDHVGTLAFMPSGPYGVVSNPNINNPEIVVPAVTVDKLLDDVGWESVDFIKMDVEGFEVAAVRGMSRLLSREDAPPILYESNGHTLNLFGETPARLMALLTKSGYRCYWVGWNRLVLCSADELQAEVCVDYLATKRPLEAQGEWSIVPAMPFEDRIRKILRSSVDPNVAARAHVARALSRADAVTLSDRRVVNALAVLKTDGDASVRTDVAWWQESEPDRTQPRFSRQGGEGDVDASASRAEAHQYYRAILQQDLQGGQVPQRQRGLVRGVIELVKRVLGVARAELRRWTKWG